MSNDLRHGAGYGYISTDGRICMITCFKCGRENVGFSVATGQCAWCAYNPSLDLEFKLPLKEPSDEQS